MIRIQWLGHACFKLTGNGYSIVIDPYADGYVPGFGTMRTSANQVICSHEHQDHGFREGVAPEPWGRENPWRIQIVDSWHDDRKGALRGANKIHILDCDDLRAVHLGDLGCMLTDEQFEAVGAPDILMIPVGGYYTIDAPLAKAIADRVKANLIIPMHYRSDRFGFDVLGTVGQFLELYPKDKPVRCCDGDQIEVSKTTGEQIVIFNQWNQK